jgi:hypothetical protein
MPLNKLCQNFFQVCIRGAAACLGGASSAQVAVGLDATPDFRQENDRQPGSAFFALHIADCTST